MNIRDLLGNDPVAMAQLTQADLNRVVVKVEPFKVFTMDLGTVAGGEAQTKYTEYSDSDSYLFVQRLMLNAATSASAAGPGYAKRMPVVRYTDGSLGKGTPTDTSVGGGAPSIDAIELQIKLDDAYVLGDPDKWLWAPALVGRAEETDLPHTLVVRPQVKLKAKAANRHESISLDMQLALRGFRVIASN